MSGKNAGRHGGKILVESQSARSFALRLALAGAKS